MAADTNTLPEEISSSSAAPEEATPGYDAIPSSGAPVANEAPGAGEGEGSAAAIDESGAAETDVSNELAQLADAYGLDREAFGTAGNLQKAVEAIQLAEDRELMRLAQQWQQGTGQPAHQPPPQHYRQPPQQQVPPDDDDGPLDLEKLLPKDEYDDGVRSAFGKIIAHQNRVMQRQQEIAQYVQQAQQASIDREIDTYFSSLGPEWEETFGKGTTREVERRNPQQFQARLRVIEQGSGLGMSEAMAGRAFTPISDLLGRGHRLAFAKESDKIQRKQLINQAQGRNGAALAKPVSKAVKPVTGNAKAIAMSKQFDRKFQLD